MIQLHSSVSRAKWAAKAAATAAAAATTASVIKEEAEGRKGE